MLLKSMFRFGSVVITNLIIIVLDHCQCNHRNVEAGTLAAVNDDQAVIINWCPPKCRCWPEEKKDGRKDLKHLPTFTIRTPKTNVAKHRYQIKQNHQPINEDRIGSNTTINTTTSLNTEALNGTKPLTTILAIRFRVDCSRRKIDDVRTLLFNSSWTLANQHVHQSPPKTEQFDRQHVSQTHPHHRPSGEKEQNPTTTTTTTATINNNNNRMRTLVIINTMNLNHNQIAKLDQKSFGHFHWQHHCHNLLLNDNLLERIPNGTFEQFTSLRYLNLASNRLQMLEAHSFLGLRKLSRLDLGSNRIQTFPINSISPNILVSLNEINLRQNFLKWIPPKAFIGGESPRANVTTGTRPRDQKEEEEEEDLNVITMAATMPSPIINLDLSQNPLISIDLDAFVQMPRLRKIYLSEIRSQEKFPRLIGTNAVEHIRLDRSNLKLIDPNLCKHVGKSLKSFVVKSNQIGPRLLFPMESCTELLLFDASYNRIKMIESKQFQAQKNLIDLSLDHNQIETLHPDAFIGLSKLKVLNLEWNHIDHIDPKTFVPLKSLNDLNLGHNFFDQLPTEGLENIIELKVHGNPNLKEFPPVESFPYVQTLAMSYAYHCCPYLGRMQTIRPMDRHHPQKPNSNDGQSGSDVQDSILWLEDINDSNVNLTITELAQQFWKLYDPDPEPRILHPAEFEDFEQELKQRRLNYETFSKDLFAALQTPQAAFRWADLMEEDHGMINENGAGVFFQQNYPHTTQKPIKCLPKPDPFMPCNDLFDWWTLRLGVWLVFPLALIGNGTVLVVLVFGRRKRRRSSKLDVPRFLVCNLAAADFFMSIYLGMLAIVDAVTLGYFRRYAISWQNSLICQFTGFAGVFSAELSVYTLAVITLERNYAITHAMHLNKRLSLRAATIIMSFGWFFALIMAVLPLLGVSDYRKVAVCLPFEIDNLVSLFYVLCLIVFNGLAFLLLMACYLRMYCAIRGSQAWNSNDTRIAMRMALLVFTDFLCWAPIAFFTITTLAGWNLITLEEAKIFTIFVLPLNACANPFLYAFFTKQFKKECTNLCKRIEQSKLFRSTTRGQNCLGRTAAASNTDLTSPPPPQPQLPPFLRINTHHRGKNDCKVCCHQHRRDLNNLDASSRSVRRIVSITSSNSGCGAGMDGIQVLMDPVNDAHLQQEKEQEQENVKNLDKLQNSNNDDDGRHSKQVIAREEEEIQPNHDDSRASNIQDCSCRCHSHHRHHRYRNSSEDRGGGGGGGEHNQKLRSVESTDGIGHGSYASNLVKHLFHSTRNDDGKKHQSNSHYHHHQPPQAKSYKCNSIIYQSNYRKNHIHMMLENEMNCMQSSLATNHHRHKTQNDSDQSSDQKHSQQESSGRKAAGGRYLSSDAKPEDSSKSVNHDDEQQSLSGGSSNRKMDTIKELDGPNLNSTTEYSQLGGPRAKIQADHFVKQHQYNTTNAMTTGIMMLKNKLIRNINMNYHNNNTNSNNSSNMNAKNCVRKLSSDSQFEFSYYSNRKDSTSTTGRLSFSSENPTRSTSSSFFSSGNCGGSSSGGRSGKNRFFYNEESTNHLELILDQNQYQHLIQLSSIFTEQMRLSLIEDAQQGGQNNSGLMKTWNDDLGNSQHDCRFILLPLMEQELLEILAERHKTFVPTNDGGVDGWSQYSNGYFQVLYLLNNGLNDNCRPNERLWLPSSSSVSLMNRNDLETFLLYQRGWVKDLDQNWCQINQCQDCLVDFVAEKLVKHLNENYYSCSSVKNGGDKDWNFLQTLSLHSSLFKCKFRLIKPELDEINEETVNSLTINFNNNNPPKEDLPRSNNYNHNFNKRPQKSKMMSQSHEKIMNFLQILLPKSSSTSASNKQINSKQPRTTSSFYRKPRVKKLQSVVTKPIRSGQRRSSSAFALSDEMMKHLQLQQYRQTNESKKQLPSPQRENIIIIGDDDNGGGMLLDHTASLTSFHQNSNNDSDSNPDARSRSVISDVIIRINSGSSINDIDSNNLSIQPMATTKIIIGPNQLELKTVSNQELSSASFLVNQEYGGSTSRFHSGEI